MKPKLRGYLHQEMFYVSLGASLLLIASCHNSIEYISVSIYTMGLLSMLAISALYHRIQWQEKSRELMRKLDHAGIYLMIAGTFTPVTLLGLSSRSAAQLLIAIWSVAVLGILKSILFPKMNKKINALLYLIAGYLGAPYFSELLKSMGTISFLLLIIGGISYSIGAVVYALKKPNWNPQVFGYHELFHAFVNIGAIIHFILIYRLINA